MSEIADKRAASLFDKLHDDDTVTEVEASECWKETFIENALREAALMVTEASMDEEGQIHPMDAVDPANVEAVYATDKEWTMPEVVIELDQLPDYVEPRITENREICARDKPGRTARPAYVRIQVR